MVTLFKPGRDPQSFKGWRPITLLSLVGKGIERLMAGRMAAATLEGGIVPPDTAGADPSRSALDLATALTHDIETASRMGMHSILSTFDIDAAYPSTKSLPLAQVLQGQGWPAQVVSLATSFSSNRTMSFRWAHNTFNTNDGLPQGSPWSPILFVLFTAPLMVQYSFGHAASYMDDMAHHTFGKDPFQVRLAASAKAWELSGRARVLGLKLDPKKSEAVYSPPQGRGSKAALMPPSTRFPSVPWGKLALEQDLTWLGAGFTPKLLLRPQVHSRVEKRRNLVGVSRRINQVGRGLPPEAARKFFQTAVVLALTYGFVALFPGLERLGRRRDTVRTGVG